MTPSIKLNSGHYIPSVGLGTWLSPPGQVGDAVKVALNNGYEHIDCAHAYRNQVEIGDALADIFSEGKIKRQNIFITSKIWNTFHSYQMAKKGMDMILSELRLDYLDLCLIHWPHGYEEGSDFYPKTADGKKFRYSNIDYLETWLAMEDYVAKGKVRSIGLSNFNHKQIQRIMDNGNIKPAILQVELHPYHQQRKLRSFCAKAGIVITAYSPLANPTMPFRKAEHPVLLEDSQILQIAGTHNKTAAQVILRWSLQHGNVIIPKSVSAEKIKENIDIFDFELKPDEMAIIDGLDRNLRLLDLTARDGDHPFFPFLEEY